MTSCGESLEQVTLTGEVYRRKILHELSTTRDVQVSVVRHGHFLEHGTLPVYIRIAFAHQVAFIIIGVGILTIVLNEAHRPHVSKTLRIEVQLMLNSNVASYECIVRVVLVGQHRGDFHSSIGCNTNLSLTLGTTLGGNQDNAVSTLHTVNGCCRSVFQH